MTGHDCNLSKQRRRGRRGLIQIDKLVQVQRQQTELLEHIATRQFGIGALQFLDELNALTHIDFRWLALENPLQGFPHLSQGVAWVLFAQHLRENPRPVG